MVLGDTGVAVLHAIWTAQVLYFVASSRAYENERDSQKLPSLREQNLPINKNGSNF
jgi:hypothetical protein